MVRILVCGDPKGQLPAVAAAVTKSCGAGVFDACFCVGSFSADEMDLDVSFPIPVYFIDNGPAAGDLISENPEGVELAPNLHFLGNYGVKSIKGLTVAFLSGKYDEAKFSEGGADGFDPPAFRGECYTSGAVTSLCSEIKAFQRKAVSNRVDLLLTGDFPEGLPESDEISYLSPAGRELVEAAGPRYHIIGGADKFWRRAPFKVSDDREAGAVRMISLGATKSAEKWMLGLAIDTENNTIPPDCTPNPWATPESESEPETAPSGSAAPADPTILERVRASRSDNSLLAMMEGMDEAEKRSMRKRFGADLLELEKNERDNQREIEREAKRIDAYNAKMEERMNKKAQPIFTWKCLGETEEQVKKGGNQRFWDRKKNKGKNRNEGGGPFMGFD